MEEKMDTIFDLRNVSYSYLGKIEALKDITIKINYIIICYAYLKYRFNCSVYSYLAICLSNSVSVNYAICYMNVF